MGVLDDWNRGCFRRTRLFVLCYAAALTVAVPAFAGGSDAFSLDWKREALLGGGALGMYAWGHFATEQASSSSEPFGWFDDEWTRPYDSRLDDVGDISCVVPIIALAFLPDRWNLESVSTIAVMYAESALLTVGVKDVLKASFLRPRPYLAYADTSAELLEDDDRFFSFPSGHTTFAFMTASFATYIFCQSDAKDSSKWLMGGLSFAAAGATAVLRVASGVHYPTDVVAGAAIGTLVGLTVPWFHRTLPDEWKLSVGTDKVTLTYSY
jgi:membrane-associated phospholipid phosphatase